MSASDVSNSFTFLGSVSRPEKSTVAASSGCSSGTDASLSTSARAGVLSRAFLRSVSAVDRRDFARS